MTSQYKKGNIAPHYSTVCQTNGDNLYMKLKVTFTNKIHNKIILRVHFKMEHIFFLSNIIFKGPIRGINLLKSENISD